MNQRCLLLLLAAFGGMHIAFSAQQPNVLFIIADDLTANALACYGNEQVLTPNIDRLANSGVQFERAYCQYPVCGPSRAAMMSGMYPQQIGVVGNGSSGKFTEVLGNRPSMSEHFKRNGYYSARVSKIYHMRVPGDITAGVDGPDHTASWTERFNCQAPEWYTDGVHEHLTNEKLNFDRDKHYNLGFGGAFYVVQGSSNGVEQADSKAADKAIELLRRHKEGPFFLAVGLVRPHVPLVAPGSFFESYRVKDMELPKNASDDQADIPKAGISKNTKSSGLEDSKKRQKVLSAYYASVSFMDAQVGRVLDELKALGLQKNTIVVFKSDHGYHLGEHDFWQKMSLHEESVRIPLIIRAPGFKPTKTDAFAEQIDLYPTLSELAGLPIPKHCRGVSLVPTMKDPEKRVREYAYTFRRNAHLIRTDQWAYISYDKGGEEVYDMRADPRQFINLANDPEYSETKKLLAQQLELHLAKLKH